MGDAKPTGENSGLLCGKGETGGGRFGEGVEESDFLTRRRWMRNAARATRERMMHPPTVPPTMGPMEGFLPPDVDGCVVNRSVGVGEAEAEADGEKVTVTVTGPALRSAVDVKPLAVQPCCVMTVVP